MMPPPLPRPRRHDVAAADIHGKTRRPNRAAMPPNTAIIGALQLRQLIAAIRTTTDSCSTAPADRCRDLRGCSPHRWHYHATDLAAPTVSPLWASGRPVRPEDLLPARSFIF